MKLISVFAAAACMCICASAHAADMKTGDTLYFDFGSAPEDGWIQVNAETKYNKDKGYGFSMMSFNENTAAPGSGVLSDAVRINRYGPDIVSFNVDLPDGMYALSVYSGNIRYMTIGLEGHSAIINIESSCTEARVEVPVSDGQLNMTFLQGNSGTDIEIAALSITRTGELADRKKRVFVCGDSTAATYYPLLMYQPLEEGYRGGWGQMLQNFLPEDLYVHNMSSSGQTAKGFIESGQLDSVLYFMQPGDYAVIAYGINDFKEYSAEEFEECLSLITEKIQEAGGIPVIASSVGQLDELSPGGGYSPADDRFLNEAEKTAEKYDVQFIDLHGAAADYFQLIGYDAARSLYWTQWNGEKDIVHPNRNGAGQLARLFVEQCVKQGITDFEGVLNDRGISETPLVSCRTEKNTLYLENLAPYEVTMHLITNNYRAKRLSKSDVLKIVLPAYDVVAPAEPVTVETLLYDSCNRIYLTGCGMSIPLYFELPDDDLVTIKD